jgi:hypothetical protein
MLAIYTAPHTTSHSKTSIERLGEHNEKFRVEIYRIAGLLPTSYGGREWLECPTP